MVEGHSTKHIGYGMTLDLYKDGAVLYSPLGQRLATFNEEMLTGLREAIEEHQRRSYFDEINARLFGGD